VTLDGVEVRPTRPRYLMLNKPRGLVTTAADERGRSTVYECLPGDGWLAPVGRLDKASEGLLLLTNDPVWAARILDPRSALPKTYHLQIDRVPDPALCERMRAGVPLDDGTRLAVTAARVLRQGQRHGWIEAVLTEGRNRHLRRLCAALGVGVLRLVRISIGPLALGSLERGQSRDLNAAELAAMISAASRGPGPRR
jgi:23S rRNA pseudouridine2605 synthase